MARVRILPIYMLQSSKCMIALIAIGWTTINAFEGHTNFIGWDGINYSPNSLYAWFLKLLMVSSFCAIWYVLVMSLWKERVLYVCGTKEQKLLKADSNGQNIIDHIPRHKLGKCFMAIRWIPPNIAVAKIRAFHVYKTRRFRPFAKFKVSVNNDEQVVGKIKQYVSTSETFRSDRWGKDTIEFSPPQDSDFFDIKIHVTSQYYEEGDIRKEKQPSPENEEYQIWVWWGLTIKEWLLLKRA